MEAVSNALTYFADMGIDKHSVEIIVGETSDRWTKAHYNRAVGFYTSLSDNQTTIRSLMDSAPRVTAKQIEELSALGVPNASDVYAADYEMVKVAHSSRNKLDDTTQKKLDVDEDGVVKEEKTPFSAEEFVRGLNGGSEE